jgi:hypothetical protein
MSLENRKKKISITNYLYFFLIKGMNTILNKKKESKSYKIMEVSKISLVAFYNNNWVLIYTRNGTSMGSLGCIFSSTGKRLMLSKV